MLGGNETRWECLFPLALVLHVSGQAAGRRFYGVPGSGMVWFGYSLITRAVVAGRGGHER